MADILPDDLFAIDESLVNLPPFDTFPVLTFEQLVLRQMTQADIPLALPIIYYNGKQAKNEVLALEVLKKTDEDYQKGGGISWIITDKKTNAIIGVCGFYRNFEGATGEIGCVAMPEYEGKGLMRKALRLIVEFGIEKMNLQRVIAITKNNNKRAIKLLHAIDFIEIAELEDDKTAYEYF